ncbi:MAG: thiamine pyrophosphate-requiring protein [Caldilinea sp. CFX5]|nr:thiamine pyrophosphate-requiring protein [Caldilinea sp. CFX5]
MNGYEAMAQILKAEGVDLLIAFPHQTLIETGALAGIRPIICRQERAGVNMADGYSRIHNGRKIGIFSMQQGPGAENAFGGVAQAFADSVPLLALPGGEPFRRLGVQPTFEAVPNYRGITKWAAMLYTTESIPAVMRRAFTQLKHGRLGPVLVEMTSDVMSAEYPGATVDYKPVERRTSAASPEDVRDLITALLKAANPVINAGQGVMYAEATPELIEFAELTHIPVMTTLAGKSGFPENHRLSLGTGASSRTLMVHRFMQSTDFVLGIGTSFTKTVFNTPMPESVPLAQVTNCAEDLNKDYVISYGAVGDAKVVLRQMIEEVKRQLGEQGRADVNGVVEQIAKIRNEWLAEWKPHFTSNEVPISPYRVFSELARAVDVANTIITHDSGYPREQLVPFWKPVTPRGYLGWGKSTQLGYGLGLALGAKLAAPQKQVINVMGDAAFGMAGLDLETAARAEIPILTVVLNNGVMTHYDSHMPYASDRFGSNELGGKYAVVAEGLGAHAEKVTTPDQLAPAIKRAIAANQQGKPALLEVMTKAEETISRYSR